MKFATIQKLFIQDKNDGLKEKQSLHVDEKGVIEDKFYNKNIERSVLLTSIKSYEKAHGKNIPLTYGQLGENILLDVNPCDLKPKTRLKINDVILEITIPCTMCKSLVCIDTSLPKLLKNDRGIFAKVIKGGKITIHEQLNIV